MPDPAKRGRTTQKRLSATANCCASFTRSMVTITRERSCANRTVLTSPISTSLYLTLVLPGSIPSAEEKLTVMVGPRCHNACATRERPITAANTGIAQTIEIRHRRGGSTTGSGMACTGASEGASVMIGLGAIPDQAGVETSGGQHGQYHDGAEGGSPGPASMTARPRKCTKPTISATTKISSMDQRPTNSMMRNRRAR